MRPDTPTPAHTADTEAAQNNRTSLWRRGDGRGRRFMRHLRHPQRGFSIVAAVFILVVLAGLGGFLVSTSSTQHATQALDFMNARAHQAARTGIEWGVYQVVKGGAYADACNAGTGYAVAPALPLTSQTLNGLVGLDGFSIVVACDSDWSQEGADPAYRVYQITATACNAAACPSPTPGFGYVEHQQRATVRWP